MIKAANFSLESQWQLDLYKESGTLWLPLLLTPLFQLNFLIKEKFILVIVKHQLDLDYLWDPSLVPAFMLGFNMRKLSTF